MNISKVTTSLAAAAAAAEKAKPERVNVNAASATAATGAPTGAVGVSTGGATISYQTINLQKRASVDSGEQSDDSNLNRKKLKTELIICPSPAKQQHQRGPGGVSVVSAIHTSLGSSSTSVNTKDETASEDAWDQQQQTREEQQQIIVCNFGSSTATNTTEMSAIKQEEVAEGNQKQNFISFTKKEAASSVAVTASAVSSSSSSSSSTASVISIEPTGGGGGGGPGGGGGTDLPEQSNKFDPLEHVTTTASGTSIILNTNNGTIMTTTTTNQKPGQTNYNLFNATSQTPTLLNRVNLHSKLKGQPLMMNAKKLAEVTQTTAKVSIGNKTISVPLLKPLITASAAGGATIVESKPMQQLPIGGQIVTTTTGPSQQTQQSQQQQQQQTQHINYTKLLKRGPKNPTTIVSFSGLQIKPANTKIVTAKVVSKKMSLQYQQQHQQQQQQQQQQLQIQQQQSTGSLAPPTGSIVTITTTNPNQTYTMVQQQPQQQQQQDTPSTGGVANSLSGGDAVDAVDTNPRQKPTYSENIQKILYKSKSLESAGSNEEFTNINSVVIKPLDKSQLNCGSGFNIFKATPATSNSSVVTSSTSSGVVELPSASSASASSSGATTTSTSVSVSAILNEVAVAKSTPATICINSPAVGGGSRPIISIQKNISLVLSKSSMAQQKAKLVTTQSGASVVGSTIQMHTVPLQQQQQQTLQQSSDQTLSDQSTKSSMQIKLTPQTLTTTAIATSSTIVAATSVASTTTTTPTKLNVSQVTKLEELSADNKTKMIIKHQQQQQQQNQVNVQDSTPSNSSSITSTTTSSSSSGGTTNATIKEQQQQSDQHNDAVLPVVAPAPAPVVTAPVAPTPPNNGQAQRVDDSNNALLKQLLQNSSSSHNLSQISITSSHVSASGPSGGGAGGVNASSTASLSARKVINVRAPSMGLVSSLEAQLARPVIPPVPAAVSNSSSNSAGGVVTSTATPSTPTTTTTATTLNQSGAPSITANPMASDQQKQQQPAVVKTEQQQPQGPPPPPPPLPSPQTHHPSHTHQTLSLPPPSSSSASSSSSSSSQQQLQLKQSVQIVSKETSFISTPHLVPVTTPLIDSTTKTEQILPPPPSYELATSSSSSSTNSTTISAPVSNVTISVSTKPIAIDQTQENESSHAGDSVPSTDQQMVVMEQQQQATQQPQQQQQQHSSTSWKLPEQLNHQANVQLEQQQQQQQPNHIIKILGVEVQKRKLSMQLPLEEKQQQQQQQLLPPPQQQHQHHAVSPVTPSSQEKVQLITGYAKKTLSNQQQSITPDMPLHQQQTTAQLHHLQQQQQAIIHHPQEPPAKPGDQRKRRKRENVQKSRRGNLNAGTPTGLGASAGGTNLKDFPIGGLMPGGNIVGTTTLPSGAVVQMATGGGLANTTAAYMQGGHPNAVGHHPAMVSNAAAAAAAASIGNSGSSPMLKKRVRKYSKVEEDHDAFTEKLMTHIKQMQPLQVLEPLLNRNFLIGCSDLGPAVASNSGSGASGGASGGGKAKSSTSGSTSGGGAGAYSRGGWPLLMRGGDDTEQLGANCKFGQVRHPSLPSLYDSERFGGHSPSLPPPGPLGGNKSLSTIQNDFYDQEFSTHLERNPRERLVRHIGAVRDSQTETIELVEQPQPLIATLPRLTRYPGLILLNNTSRCHGIAGGRMSPVALSEDFTTLRLPISPVLRSCAEELRKSQHLEMGGPAGGSHNNNNNNNNYQQKNQNVILSLHSSASDNIVGVLRDLANLLHLTPSPGISCRVIDDKSTLEKTTTDATPEAGAAAAPAAGEDGGGGSDTEGNRERISQSHLRKILMGRRKICRGCDSAIAAFGIRVPKDEQSPEDKPSPRLAQLQALLPGYVPQPAYDYFCSRTCLTKHKWSTTSTSGGQQTDSTASTKPSALAKMKLSASASPDELQSKINEIPTAKRKCIVKCFSADCFGPATTTAEAAEDSKGAVPPNNTVWETGDSGQQQQLEDTRQCVFCNQRGDGLADGPSRLLNFDVDKWVHLNCALWSNGVYETVSGALMNFQIALQAGLNQSCSACHLLGATIKCFKSRCNAIYHLPCAIKEDCMFYKNKSVHCSAHAAAASSIGGSSGGSGSNSVSGSSGSGSAMATGGGAADNELSSFIVHRRVFVDRDENRQVATVMHYSELSNLLRVGNMTFLNVGQLLPHQLEAFHTPHHIYPIGYKVSRYYWCLRRPNRRCRYICSIAEAGCRPEFRILVQDTGDKAEPDREFRDSTPTAVWQQILQPIQRLRKVHKWLQLFPQHISGEDLFGLTEPAIVRILESLPGIETLTDYRFKYGRNPLLEFPLAINPSGAARTEPKQRQLLVWRKPHTQRTAGSCSSTQRMANSAAIAGEVACPYSKQFVHSKSSQYKKMKQEWRNNVYLARSKIQGLGLYAARDIEKHTMIIEYIGEVIRTEVSEIREKQYEAKNRGIYMFRLDEDRVVDATLSGGLARYINHSCNPNCVTEIVEVDRDVRIIIFAKRKIYRGEELSYDYKFDIEDESHKIPCACGAPNCRKWMN